MQAKKDAPENVSPDAPDTSSVELEELEQDLAKPFKLEYLEDKNEFPYTTTINWRGQDMLVDYKVVNIGERLALEGNLVAFELLQSLNKMTLADENEKSAEELLQLQLDETELTLQHIKVCVKQLVDADLEQIRRLHPLDLRKLYDLTSGAIRESSLANRFQKRDETG